ncbi:MAG: prepilin-type N-terminal cleavage/methylation domain-containing protein [Akkermansiaceae bacterium]|nr:prepilin-type N-terminal cleavage/methylation domain-containing protein [Akkermansiaceae bacterium]
MKTNRIVAARGFTLVELLVVIVIIAALAGLSAPMIMRQVKKADLTEGINNARQISLALNQFEQDYGSFPDDETAIAVKDNNDNAIVSGSSANDRFRQLIRANTIDSETVFYCKTSYTKKPDNNMQNDKALDKGEVGFGIIMTADNRGLSTSGSSARPILAAPFTAIGVSTRKPLFDSDAYLGKGVVLKMDGSVSQETIAPTTKALKLNGKDILKDGEGTVWGPGSPVQFAYPAARGGGGSTTTTNPSTERPTL